MKSEPHVVLYTRQGCHLCDEAEEVLRAHGLHPEIVDIDENPELLPQYTECVPVVRINGQDRFRGKVSPILLKRLLVSL